MCRFLRNRGWASIFILNTFIFFVFVSFGVTAVVFSLKSIVQQAQSFGVFAECYQCPPNWKKLATKG